MSSQRASAREAIATVGHALAGQSQPIMFVGGTVTALYPLEGGMALRPTLDVDCVVDVATTADYYAFVETLRVLGFRECTDENAPLCRRVYEDIRVDIVATSATGIGPTNRWYRDAFAEAAVHSLERNIQVRAITPLYFVATKLEAFRGRGAGDYQASHDLEDILTVLSGLADYLGPETLRSGFRTSRFGRLFWRQNRHHQGRLLILRRQKRPPCGPPTPAS
jgi:predicted nucleotidyltransferase